MIPASTLAGGPVAGVLFPTSIDRSEQHFENLHDQGGLRSDFPLFQRTDRTPGGCLAVGGLNPLPLDGVHFLAAFFDYATFGTASG
jgi:hypothetical protein